MRPSAILTLALATLATVAAIPAASAAVTLPKELCRPGEAGVCHWYTPDGNSCAIAHLGTMWAGGCTTGEPTEPLAVCTTIQTGLWDGWCWAGGNIVQNLVDSAKAVVDELVP